MYPQNNQNYDREVEQIRELVTKNEAGVIVLPAKPTPDAIAAGTSLYLALTKMGKNVAIAASTVPQSDMAAADKIQTKLATGGDNLVVSFPYVEGAIDKVDYNIVESKFNLLIIPRPGHPKLEPKDVEFTYSGGKIDFIITVDTPSLNALGDIYQKNQSSFQSKNVINIDRHLINNNYGVVNLVAKQASSTSEIVFKLIIALKVEVDKDMATNLYAGIVTATNNFTSYSVNADTFEAISMLLRAGAVKRPMRPMGARPGMPPGGYAPIPGMNPYGAQPYMQPRPIQGYMNPMNPFDEQPGMMGGMPQAPRPASTPQQIEKKTKPLEDVEKSTDKEGGDDDNDENWLKPKVFSESGGLV